MHSCALFNYLHWHSLRPCPVAPSSHSPSRADLHIHTQLLSPLLLFLTRILLNTHNQRHPSTRGHVLLTFRISEHLPPSDPPCTNISCSLSLKHLPPSQILPRIWRSLSAVHCRGKMQIYAWVRRFWLHLPGMLSSQSSSSVAREWISLLLTWTLHRHPGSRPGMTAGA